MLTKLIIIIINYNYSKVNGSHQKLKLGLMIGTFANFMQTMIHTWQYIHHIAIQFHADQIEGSATRYEISKSSDFGMDF